MAERSEATIVVLVLGAVGLVLIAPVLGRAGAATAADGAMLAAALCGVLAFVLAGAATLRAARRAGSRPPDTRDGR